MTEFSKISEINRVWTRTQKFKVDTRGTFSEIFRYEDSPIPNLSFVQDSFSSSKVKVLRGLHVQVDQWQLVTVVTGSIIDFLIDLNPLSKSYLQVHQRVLTSGGDNQILIGPGIAHGFYVPDRETIVHYKSSKYYGETEQFVINILDDPFKVVLPKTDYICSDRDKSANPLSFFLTDLDFLNKMRA